MKRRQLAACLLGFGALALGFQFVRARYLLGAARLIATQSAGFPRNYSLGKGPLLTYLVMGDSTAAGWGAGDLASTYPHQVAAALAARRHLRVHVLNVAVGGATLAQVRRDQVRFLKTVRPDFITLSAGANDATHRTSDADFRREMGEMLAELQNSSADVVLVADVPDMSLAPALPFPISRAVGKRAEALNAVFAGRPKIAKIRLVPLFEQGKLDYRTDKTLYAADLFHPSARGYAVWARVFLRRLEEADAP